MSASTVATDFYYHVNGSCIHGEGQSSSGGDKTSHQQVQLYKDLKVEFLDFLGRIKQTKNGTTAITTDRGVIDATNEEYLTDKHTQNKISELFKRCIDICELRGKKLHLLQQAIESTVACIITDTKLRAKTVSARLSDAERQYEAHFLELVLQYYSVLKDEWVASRGELEKQRDRKSTALLHAEVNRDFKYFAFHLRNETSGIISLSLVNTNSAQYERCVRAVIDNKQLLESKQSDKSEYDMKVLNVLKLNNSFLSRKLKVSST